MVPGVQWYHRCLICWWISSLWLISNNVPCSFVIFNGLIMGHLLLTAAGSLCSYDSNSADVTSAAEQTGNRFDLKKKRAQPILSFSPWNHSNGNTQWLEIKVKIFNRSSDNLLLNFDIPVRYTTCNAEDDTVYCIQLHIWTAQVKKWLRFCSHHYVTPDFYVQRINVSFKNTSSKFYFQFNATVRCHWSHSNHLPESQCCNAGTYYPLETECPDTFLTPEGNVHMLKWAGMSTIGRLINWPTAFSCLGVSICFKHFDLFLLHWI